jgi:hypothetical protein
MSNGQFGEISTVGTGDARRVSRWHCCRGGYAVVTSGWCGSGPPWCNGSRANVGEQIGDGDRVIAMWAGSARTKPSAKDAAIVTALLTEEAGFAFGALVDDRRGGQPTLQAKTQLVCRPLTTTEASLTADVRAV